MSEREKNELVQLVDTMVAYSVTYKNTKFEPQERANGSIVPMDIPSLSFDPPINDIISFKVLPNFFFFFFSQFSHFSLYLTKMLMSGLSIRAHWSLFGHETGLGARGEQ